MELSPKINLQFYGPQCSVTFHRYLKGLMWQRNVSLFTRTHPTTSHLIESLTVTSNSPIFRQNLSTSVDANTYSFNVPQYHLWHDQFTLLSSIPYKITAHRVDKCNCNEINLASCLFTGHFAASSLWWHWTHNITNMYSTITKSNRSCVPFGILCIFSYQSKRYDMRKSPVFTVKWCVVSN